MAAKNVWLTWMTEGDPTGPEAVVSALGKAGFAVAGAPWIDDLEKHGWVELGNHLAKDETADVWVVAGARADLMDPRKRYGLSMVAATLRARRSVLPQVVVLGTDGVPEEQELPTLLRGAKRLEASSGWAERALAATIRKPSAPDERFRFDVIADPHVGQWFEVGPAQGTFSGAMLGITGGGTIVNHAVGPSGGLPERTVLEFALEGITADIAGDEFTLWAVANELGNGDSYYVKIDGQPTKLVIGEHPDQDADVSVLELQ